MNLRLSSCEKLIWSTLLAALATAALPAGTGTEADPFANNEVPNNMNGGSTWYEFNDGAAYTRGFCYLGNTTAENHLTVRNSTDLTYSTTFFVGMSASSIGNTAVIEGVGSTLVAPTYRIGGIGGGSLDVRAGASATSDGMLKVGDDGGTGRLAVSGAAADGTASTFTVTKAGYESSYFAHIGRNGATGSVTVSDGGVLQFTGNFSRVLVANGGNATGHISVSGRNPVNGAASQLSVNGQLYLGYTQGVATLDVSKGGQVQVSSDLQVGMGTGASAAVRVDGAGSLVNVGMLSCNDWGAQADLAKFEMSHGGLLACSTLSSSGTNTEFYFDGGMLAVSGDVSSTIVGTLLSGNSKLFAYDPNAGGYVALTSTTYNNALSVLYYADASQVSSLLTGSYTVVTSLYASVPEPATFALCGGVVVLGFAFWRRLRARATGGV